MSLADAFPENLRNQSALRQIQPGAVVKFMARMDDGRVQEKRFVVLAVTQTTLTCVINSEINAYIAQREALLRCQVEMLPDTHPFMDHPSHVDCSRIRAYPVTDIQRQLAHQPAWVMGRITASLRDQIVSALKFSLSPPKQVMLCCECLESIQLD